MNDEYAKRRRTAACTPSRILIVREPRFEAGRHVDAVRFQTAGLRIGQDRPTRRESESVSAARSESFRFPPGATNLPNRAASMPSTGRAFCFHSAPQTRSRTPPAARSVRRMPARLPCAGGWQHRSLSLSPPQVRQAHVRVYTAPPSPGRRSGAWPSHPTSTRASRRTGSPAPPGRAGEGIWFECTCYFPATHSCPAVRNGKADGKGALVGLGGPGGYCTIVAVALRQESSKMRGICFGTQKLL